MTEKRDDFYVDLSFGIVLRGCESYEDAYERAWDLAHLTVIQPDGSKTHYTPSAVDVRPNEEIR